MESDFSKLISSTSFIYGSITSPFSHKIRKIKMNPLLISLIGEHHPPVEQQISADQIFGKT